MLVAYRTFGWFSRILRRVSVVIITGAAGGVGRACAQRFGAQHRLVLGDVAEADGIVAGDVRDPEYAQRLVAQVDGDHLAAVICAAGLSPHMASSEDIFSVNLIGTANLLAAVEPLLAPGTVAVCIASISGHRIGVREHDDVMAAPLRPGIYEEIAAAEGEAWKPGLAYAVSKRGVIAYVERLARPWGERGARIVSISPGLIDTPMGRLEAAQSGGNARQLTALSALDRAASPDEIAAAAEFLASPAAGYVTGCDLKVDGGTIAELAWHAGADVRAGWDRPQY
jgi:NAD(P)-dependent dehydrogenase (short-subunit alcohol dehydrogenase family)